MKPRRPNYLTALLLSALVCGVSITRAQPVGASQTPSAQQAADDAAALSNTVGAARSVRITWDPGAARPDAVAAAMKLISPKVAGPIATAVLGLPPGAVATVIKPQGHGGVQWADKGDEMYFEFSVHLDPAVHPNARPAAKEFADRLVEQFESLLAQETEQRMQPRLQNARERVARAAGDYDELSQRLRKSRAEMTREAGRADASPESLRAALTKLEDERQRLELEIAGMDARQKAVEQWIEQTTAQLQARVKEDPVVEELEKVVKAHERLVALERHRFEQGIAPSSGLAEAEAKHAEARVQLLDRQRGGGGAAGGGSEAADPVAALNKELRDISIDMVDRKARLEYVVKRLAPVQAAAELAPDVEALMSELPHARRELDEAKQHEREVRRQVEEMPRVRALVVAAKDTPAKK